MHLLPVSSTSVHINKKDLKRNLKSFDNDKTLKQPNKRSKIFRNVNIFRSEK